MIIVKEELARGELGKKESSYGIMSQQNGRYGHLQYHLVIEDNTTELWYFRIHGVYTWVRGEIVSQLP